MKFITKKTLIERIESLEKEVDELRRCKHEDHTISAEAVTTIAAIVRKHIASVLMPPEEPAKQEEASEG